MASVEIEGIKLTRFGHASFMIKAEGKIIYIDPFILPKNPKKADVIFMTHDHYDHCANYDILAKENTVLVTTKACSAKLGANAQIVTPGSKGDADGIKYEAVYAYNPTKQFHPKGIGVGFVINIGGKRIYHAGDTELIPEMKNLKNIDIALLPVGGTYTMDVAQAVKAAQIFKPKIVVPMHYGNTASIPLPVDAKEIETAFRSTGIRVIII